MLELLSHGLLFASTGQRRKRRPKQEGKSQYLDESKKMQGLNAEWICKAFINNNILVTRRRA
jgi:hypothetical protein